MVSVSVKLKKADASTYVEHFDTLPTWEVLTSRISERFNIPSSNVVVGYVDDALDTVTLTNDQGLLGYYDSLGQSPKIKFVVLDRHTPDGESLSVSSHLRRHCHSCSSNLNHGLLAFGFRYLWAI